MLQRIRKFTQKGQGIVEYALILAFVVAIAAVALSTDSGIGQAVQNVFSRTATQLDSAGGNTGGGTGGGTGN